MVLLGDVSFNFWTFSPRYFVRWLFIARFFLLSSSFLGYQSAFPTKLTCFLRCRCFPEMSRALGRSVGRGSSRCCWAAARPCSRSLLRVTPVGWRGGLTTWSLPSTFKPERLQQAVFKFFLLSLRAQNIMWKNLYRYFWECDEGYNKEVKIVVW